MWCSVPTAGVHFTSCVLKIRANWQLFKHIFLFSWSIIHRYSKEGKWFLLAWSVHRDLSMACNEICGYFFPPLCPWFSFHSSLFASPGSHGLSSLLVQCNVEHETLDLSWALEVLLFAVKEQLHFLPCYKLQYPPSLARKVLRWSSREVKLSPPCHGPSAQLGAAHQKLGPRQQEMSISASLCTQ